MAQWTDWLHQQQTSCELVVVESRAHLMARLDTLLRERHLAGKAPPKLKVRSSGHATSDVGKPADLLIELDREKWHDDVQDPKWLVAQDAHGRKPIWLPANATIRRANALLASVGRAFANLGSYDQQSVFGAITTGTHGTGAHLPPLADLVVAIDVVVVRPGPNGVPRCESMRIEAVDNPVCTAAYGAAAAADPTLPRLVQNTRLFDAAVVSFGCFGIVTGVVVATRPTFWLKEQRTVTLWQGAKAHIVPNAPNEAPWLDLAITGRKLVAQQDYGVIVTRRTECPPGEHVFVRNDRRTQTARKQFDQHGPDRNDVAAFIARAGVLAPDLAVAIAWNSFKNEAASKPFISRSDKVLFTSIGDYVGVSSCELCVPIDDWKNAVTTTLATLGSLGNAGYHSLTPVGVRFTAPSRFLLAPERGRATCTIEVGCLVGIFNVLQPGLSTWQVIDHILSTVEKELVTKHHARPHWGQRFFSTQAELESSYPPGVWAEWKTQRDKLDPLRLFDNAFTARTGL